jgi:PadR family transcriptional regulator, regulatory protein PadR
MPKRPQHLLQGTLDLLILRSLIKGEMHGSAISRWIEYATHGAFLVKPGSLFPALQRLEQAGSLVSFGGASETNRRAKYYRLTESGKRQLQIEVEEWDRVSAGIGSALRAR